LKTKTFLFCSKHLLFCPHLLKAYVVLFRYNLKKKLISQFGFDKKGFKKFIEKKNYKPELFIDKLKMQIYVKSTFFKSRTLILGVSDRKKVYPCILNYRSCKMNVWPRPSVAEPDREGNELFILAKKNLFSSDLLGNYRVHNM
jgi:hypothetical protein